jgi:phosphatidylglycerol:prolipoprotein diacylglycerol transferase
MNPTYFGTISFPSFGIEINPGRALSIGPLSIHYYGLVIALGLMLAVIYACRRSKQFGLKEDDLLDGVLWVTPFAILCARIYYCAFSWEQYADDPISVLYIWQGGIAIYGGVIGAVLGVIVFCKVKKVKIATVLDIMLLGFLIGQSLGRWGNFFNREAFGAETDSFFRMGLTHTLTGETQYYHPTFLYESLWNAVGFLLLHFFSKRRRYDGQIALMYAAWYGLGRCIIEGLRVDSLWWGPFRVSQLLAGVSCITAVSLLLWQHFKPHDPKNLFVNQVAAGEKAPEEATTESGEENTEA